MPHVVHVMKFAVLDPVRMGVSLADQLSMLCGRSVLMMLVP